MEQEYVIGVTNRYALFLEESSHEEDPFEIIKNAEAEKTKKKTLKTVSGESKENKGKPEPKQKNAVNPARKSQGIKETQNVKPVDPGAATKTKSQDGALKNNKPAGGRKAGDKPQGERTTTGAGGGTAATTTTTTTTPAAAANTTATPDKTVKFVANEPLNERSGNRRQRDEKNGERNGEVGRNRNFRDDGGSKGGENDNGQRPPRNEDSQRPSRRDRDGERPFRDGERSFRDGERSFRDGERSFRDGERSFRDGERSFRDGERSFRDGERSFRDGERSFRDGERSFRDGERPFRDGERSFRDGERSFRDGERSFRDGERPFRDGERPFRDGERPFRDGERPFRDGERSFRDGERSFRGGDRDRERNDRQQGDNENRPPRREGRERREFQDRGDFTRDGTENGEGRPDRRQGNMMGRGKGGRQGGGPGGRNFDNKGKREFERKSGSDKTGVKAIDKREGGGAHNWGNHKDDLESVSNNWNSTTLSEDNPEWEKTPENNAYSGEGKETETNEPENESFAVVEEEPKELTLDEYRALRGKRELPQYNLRKAGEGEDLSQWKNMYEIKKKRDSEEPEEEEFDTTENLQRAGRQRHVLDIDITFSDARRGPRGARGGRAPRAGLNASAGGGRNRQRDGPRRGRDDRGDYGGGRDREYNSRGNRQSAPKVDDEHDFPSLG